MNPGELISLLEDMTNIPTAVIKYCILPYIYENTNRQRKRLAKDRARLNIQLRQPWAHYKEKEIVIQEATMKYVPAPPNTRGFMGSLITGGWEADKPRITKIVQRPKFARRMIIDCNEYFNS